MFLRRCVRRKNGKQHTYWALLRNGLVESYRTAKGSRQRVVADLGELKPSEQDGWAKPGSHLEGRDQARRPPLSWFDPPRTATSSDAAPDDEPVQVRLSGVRLERLRDFGDVWLAWGLWRMLELDDLLEHEMAAGREEISWATMAAILTIARFCEPSSELHIEEKWYRRTALEELLGVAPEKVHTDRLYDVTSTYFEGDMEGCPIAPRGASRDSRGDPAASLHWAGRDRGGLSAGLRSLRWQHA